MQSALIDDIFLCLLKAEQLPLIHSTNHKFLMNSEHLYLLLTVLERVITHILLSPRALSYCEIGE